MEEEKYSLSNVALFKALDEESLALLADKLTLVKFPEGIVVKEGDPGDAAYIIKSGTANVTKSAESGGAEVVLASLKPGATFGEVAILDNMPRTATVVATEDMECYRLSRDDFLAVLDDHPEIAKGMLFGFASMVRNTNQMINGLLNWMA